MVSLLIKKASPRLENPPLGLCFICSTVSEVYELTFHPHRTGLEPPVWPVEHWLHHVWALPRTHPLSGIDRCVHEWNTVRIGKEVDFSFSCWVKWVLLYVHGVIPSPFSLLPFSSILSSLSFLLLPLFSPLYFPPLDPWQSWTSSHDGGHPRPTATTVLPGDPQDQVLLAQSAGLGSWQCWWEVCQRPL